MLDIALDARTHDIVLKDGDMLFIDNAERDAQQIKIQLLTFYGEWYLDTSWGVPYLDYILVKNPNFTIIRQIFKEQILSVDDVKAVESLEVEYDAQERTMKVDYIASTEYGLITRKEILGYGIR